MFVTFYAGFGVPVDGARIRNRKSREWRFGFVEGVPKAVIRKWVHASLVSAIDVWFAIQIRSNTDTTELIAT